MSRRKTPCVPSEFDAALGEHLDWIDRVLVEKGVGLKTRPVQAAIMFVEECVSALRDAKNEQEQSPGSFLEYAGSDWFKIVYARTVAWYKLRFGSSIDAGSHRLLHGVVLVLGTPFRLRVPATTAEPEVPGETSWLSWHDRVEDSENSLSWLVQGPNFASIPRSDGLKARRLANEVASNLRCIHVQLMTVKSEDSRVSELRDAIYPQLERAADEIARAKPEHLKAAHWPLHMSCELALKVLLQQSEGTFPESHDLHFLYDKIPTSHVPFDRRLLSRMPHWQRMAEWRYGSGSAVNVIQAFARYRVALRILRGAAVAADRNMDLSGVRILLKRAPYLSIDLNMYEPLIRATDGTKAD
jgi:hypothetical protein